jgi:hypothetical protein
MRVIERQLSDRVERDGFNGEYVFQSYEVTDAVSRLKLNKRDGCDGILTNNFKYTNYLFVHVAHLLSSAAVHASVPDDFLMGTFIPIPKGNNANDTASENYRDITSSSVFGRILDSIILSSYASLLVTSDLQFGFKRKRSTAMCTMGVKELIYYMNHDSSVFCIIALRAGKLYWMKYTATSKTGIPDNLPSIGKSDHKTSALISALGNKERSDRRIIAEVCSNDRNGRNLLANSLFN